MATKTSTDESVSEPYTIHIEPLTQGGESYVRCRECGAELLESLGGWDFLIHRETCSRREVS